MSVTARAVSSTGTMPVHFELVEEVLFFVMCSPWSCESVLYGFSRPCTWIAGISGRTAVSSATTEGISIAVGPAGSSWFCSFQRLRAVMSPREVVARMSSSAVPSFLRALLTRP